MPQPTAARSWVDHYAALLRECADRGALREGRIVHASLLLAADADADADADGGGGADGPVLLRNLVVDMYGKCGSVAEARRAFDALGSRRNVYSWSIIIAAYARCGHFRDALQLFRAMDLDGVVPNAFTFSSVAAACGGVADPRQALQLHARIVATGFGGHQFVATAAIAMFGRCQGCWIQARSVFLAMDSRSVVAWNAAIAAAVRAGEQDQALGLLQRMDNQGIGPDEFTLTSILPACSSARQCRQLHDRIRASGFESMLAVQNALVDCYGRCGRLRDAEAVFAAMTLRDVISWTCLIASSLHNGESRRALALLERMDVEPNVCTFTAAAEACSSLGDLAAGLTLQARISSSDIDVGDSAELGAALVEMFVRCGSWIHAKAVLDAVCVTSAAAWSLVISAVARDESSSPGRALELLAEMALGGTKADAATLAAAMSSAFMAVDRGRSLHSLAREAGLDGESSVGAALIAMYSRAGMPDEAREAFDRISDKSVLAWSALMACYAQLGHNRAVLELYREMIEVAGIEADKHALATVLGTCAELGAGDEGRAAHWQMVGLECDVVLGTSLLDMYARCGAIDSARRVFDGMPERNARTWTALIAGLARHGRGDEAVCCLHAMGAQGVEPDAVTLSSVLHGCSHGGLLAAARRCVRLLCGEYGAQASCEHLDCFIDVLGRAGRLADAERLAADAIPAGAQEPARRILLGGCRIHGDLGAANRAIGVQASHSLSDALLLSAIFSDDAVR